MNIEDKYLKEEYTSNIIDKFEAKLWKDWLSEIDRFAKSHDIEKSLMRSDIAEGWYNRMKESGDIDLTDYLRFRMR